MCRTSTRSALAVALVLAACAVPESEPESAPVVDAATVEAEVAAAMASFRDMMLANDVEGVVAAYAADAAMSEPDIDWSGAQVHDGLRQLLASVKVTGFEPRARERFVHGDVVYERGEYDESIEMGGAAITVQGLYFIRWQKGADGTWRIHRLNAGPRSATPPAP